MNASLRILTPLLAFAALFLDGCFDSADDGAQSLTITGSSTVAPVIADAAKRFEEQNPGTRIDVQTGGSSRGIADAESGLADLGMASRALKPAETGLTPHQIAVDGVCLIVHAQNPVRNLTRDQVIAIYKGEITNWSEVGGPEAEIVVGNKAEGTGTLEVFLNYTGLDSADIQPDVVLGMNQHAIKTVAGNPQALGYVSIGAAASEAEAGTPIKLIGCDGVPATTAAVAHGDFPITRPLQVVSRGELSPLASHFLDYLKSPAVHDIIESHLYVPAAP